MPIIKMRQFSDALFYDNKTKQSKQLNSESKNQKTFAKNMINKDHKQFTLKSDQATPLKPPTIYPKTKRKPKITQI